MKAHFYKYQALGNDMIVIDPSQFAQPLSAGLARAICDRHFGLGADGLCYGPLGVGQHPLQMRFFNPDGSEAEKSGNGLRIFARYLWDQGYVARPDFTIAIKDQVIDVMVRDAQAGVLALGMGYLSFNSIDIPLTGPSREVVEEPLILATASLVITAVTIGNPHCVIFTEHPLAQQAQTLGPLIETAAQFPNRTNVQLARVINRHALAIEIWERGAGYTLASGTSACAAAGAAIRTGRCASPVEVRMAGGSALVEIDDRWRVTLTGPVEAVCSGQFSKDFLNRTGKLSAGQGLTQ